MSKRINWNDTFSIVPRSGSKIHSINWSVIFLFLTADFLVSLMFIGLFLLAVTVFGNTSFSWSTLLIGTTFLTVLQMMAIGFSVLCSNEEEKRP